MSSYVGIARLQTIPHIWAGQEVYLRRFKALPWVKILTDAILVAGILVAGSSLLAH
jgi:hypothetical protein